MGKKIWNLVCNVDVVAADEQNRFKVKCLRLSSRTTKPFTTSLFDLVLLQNFSHYYLQNSCLSLSLPLTLGVLGTHLKKKNHTHRVCVCIVYKCIYFERLALWFDVCAWSWCKCGKCMQHAYSMKMHYKWCEMLNFFPTIHLCATKYTQFTHSIYFLLSLSISLSQWL